MSRTGKRPIKIPDKVKVQVTGGTLKAKGPLGEQALPIYPEIEVVLDEKTVTVRRRDDSQKARSLHGLLRSLVFNAVNGVAVGFEKKLEINGVGYRAESKGNVLKLTLGYSHPIEYAIPEGIKIAVKDQTRVTVSGRDKELVGRVCAQLRALRPPEPYKGKGIKYAEERILRKVGKAAGGK